MILQREIFTGFCLLLLCQSTLSDVDAHDGTSAPYQRGVMENIGEGIRYAGQMFGINTAADVANLVAKAFSTTQTRTQQTKPDLLSLFANSFLKPQTDKQPLREQQDYSNANSQEQATDESTKSEQNSQDEQPPPPTPTGNKPSSNFSLDFNAGQLLSTMLRMVGFDPSRLGALAINAIIMLAQTIGNTMLATLNSANTYNAAAGNSNTGPEAYYSDTHDNANKPRALRGGTPIDWFLENPTEHMQHLLSEMSDRKLPDKITELIEHAEEQNGAKAGCVKMLMCKSAPFIWGMQKSLAKRMNFKLEDNDHSDSEREEGAAEASESGGGRPSTRVFFEHLPSISEYREHGAKCEKTFADVCDLSGLNRPPK